MNIMDMLQQSGGIGTMAKELGVNESVAQAGAAALLPAILGGFKKTTQAQPSGLDGLGGLLGQLGGGGLLDSVLGTQPTPVSKGNEVLGQIFGSKEVSRTVAAGAEQQTGISSDLLKKMLPVVAMMVAGYMAKESSGSAGNGGGLGGLIGGLLGGGSKTSGGGLGGVASMLDLNGDGNPLDDIIGMAGKLVR
ncbi:DUF937 domain-containing protein [Parasphingorhabdus flavimaris]|jgi:hypothetical protein|uniref:DUF937 domain-containing protein n=1 Tax=Parasphingorhabdus flavimaris TaxID=266812 RepID=A0ABX2N100_9SPHN|nr:DUF937 domain-containing protein [Parasphingorhabdus flavimaris]NVD27382.1 DUF937 domain-containing protein [Parasphingorhabdus flavimaris]|tara:strand:- start:14666 stop:15241 length:576 start_codon:yes stop_codon:yes gene_type:complete